VQVTLALLGVVRALIELAGLFLLGRGALYVLAGAQRERNPVYRLFHLLTQPVLKVVRRLMPRVIVDRHIPVVAFFVLFWLWIALAYLRHALCGGQGLTC